MFGFSIFDMFFIVLLPILCIGVIYALIRFIRKIIK
jgi:uncharacterized membrane protein YhdT